MAFCVYYNTIGRIWSTGVYTVNWLNFSIPNFSATFALIAWKPSNFSKGIPKYYKVKSLIVAHFGTKASCWKRYKPFTFNERGQCCSKFQAAKAQKLHAKAVAGFLSDGINWELVGRPQKSSAEPGQQTSRPCPDPASQQSNSDE